MVAVVVAVAVVAAVTEVFSIPVAVAVQAVVDTLPLLLM
jgi:hypothetical protein